MVKVCPTCGSDRPEVRDRLPYRSWDDPSGNQKEYERPLCDNTAFHDSGKPDTGRTHYIGDACKGGHLDYAQHPDLLEKPGAEQRLMTFAEQVRAASRREMFAEHEQAHGPDFCRGQWAKYCWMCCHKERP